MTQDERLHNKALREGKKYAKSHGRTALEEVCYGRGFKSGANWALANLWMSAEKELPDKDGVYLVLINSKVPVITTFDGKMMQWELKFPYSLSVTHWMPIPKLSEQ